MAGEFLDADMYSGQSRSKTDVYSNVIDRRVKDKKMYGFIRVSPSLDIRVKD